MRSRWHELDQFGMPGDIWKLHGMFFSLLFSYQDENIKV